MSGQRYLDAPISIQPSHSTSQNKDGHPKLYTNQGNSYSLYLSATLPKDDLSSSPSKEYLDTTEESPSAYDPKSFVEQGMATRPQRQLIVLDLNGSLLYRNKSSKTFNGSKSRSISRRPYVTCLAQYLAHERTRNAVLVEQRAKKVYWVLPSDIKLAQSLPKKKGKKRRKPKPVMNVESLDGEMTLDIDYLRKKTKSHPERFTLLAPLDAMVWSSVQPQNLLGMVDAAFGIHQEALKACWTRSMLGLEKEGYYNKVQTTKNLERIWWSSNNEYGAKSTLLMDDTAAKARLQPLNLLQISEYTLAEARASNVVGESRGPDENGTSKDSRSPEPDEEKEKDVDTTLLAVIGILEEMRMQSNVPAWIKGGGLWANVPQSESINLASSVPEVIPVQMHPREEESEDQAASLWCTNPSVLSYWTERGIEVLKSRGIPVIIGALNTHSEVLQSLRTHAV